MNTLREDTKDWWDELTEEDKNRVMESEAQYEKGDFISHEELMRQAKIIDRTCR